MLTLRRREGRGLGPMRVGRSQMVLPVTRQGRGLGRNGVRRL